MAGPGVGTAPLVLTELQGNATGILLEVLGLSIPFLQYCPEEMHGVISEQTAVSKTCSFLLHL